MTDDEQLSEEKQEYLEAVVTSYKSDPALREKNRRREEEAVRGEAEPDGPTEDDASDGNASEEQ